MYYDKRIRYLSYYESGIKLQNAGYVKFQVRDSLCQMIIYVKGPRLMGSGEAAVYLLSTDQKETDEDSFYAGSRDSHLRKHLLGNLTIRGGQGHCAVRMNARNMADSGLRYDEICGIKIELHEYQYLESIWNCCISSGDTGAQNSESKTAGYRLRQEQKDMRQEDYSRAEDAPVEVSLIVTPVSEGVRVEKIEREESLPEIREIEEVSEKGYVENSPEVPDETAEEEPEKNKKTEYMEISAGDEDSMQGMLEREIRKETVNQTLEEEIMEGLKGAEEAEEETNVQRAEEELQPDKWEQLRKTYPIVHPIREEEEYLKVAPKDFVIFTEKYQELVHNSFLLHGYYNYKHLILGKKEKDGKAVYYLGVPGTFHDREKSVAVMFGFEAFDGKREPAEKGDFGYYLRRVEI